MNVCKLLNLNPGYEMSSYGTLHFPEDNRVIEWQIFVEKSSWKSTRFGPCTPGPEGGYPAVRKGWEEVVEEWLVLDDWSKKKSRLELVCREGVSVDDAVHLVMGELGKARFPYSLAKEAEALRRRLRICSEGTVRAKAARRFEVE